MHTVCSTEIKQLAKYLDKNERFIPLLKKLKLELMYDNIIKDTSPSFLFLNYLIETKFSKQLFCQSLEELNYEPPLLLFKDPVLVIIIKQPPKSIELQEGSDLNITCLANGFPHPVYQWFKNKNIIKLQNLPLLEIRLTNLEDSGLYTCRVNNAGMKQCVFSNWCEVTIIENLGKKFLTSTKPPKITRNPVASLEINEFTTFTLTCLAIGIPNVLYQWYKNSIPILDQISSNLQITNVSSNDEGIYQCKASNSAGAVWSCQSQIKIRGTDDKSEKTNLTDQLLPDIIYHPQTPNDKIVPGSSIILACKAIGKEPLRFEWYKDNKILCGCESNELRLFNIQSDKDDARCYQCRVYNSYGSTLSKPAFIKIDHCAEISQLTATDKIAFLFGNYSYAPILTPLSTVENDLRVLSQTFRDMGFKVFSHSNLTYQEMKVKVAEIHDFLDHSQGPRVYLVFYFGGHGFEMNGKSYLVPVPHSSNQCLIKDMKKDFKHKSICVESDILKPLNARNQKPCLIVFLLDICRLEEEQNYPFNFLNLQHDYSPNTHSFIKDEKQLATNSYSCEIGGNYIFGYATSTSFRAFEMEGQSHSIFVTHLLKFLKLSIPIEDILRKTRQSVFATEPLAKINNQYPEIKSNLSKNFSLADKVVKF